MAVPGPGSSVSGVTLEAIELTFQWFDFTCQWLGPDRLGSQAILTAALQTRADANPVDDIFEPDLSVSPLSISWTAGTDAGTVKETIKSFDVEIPGGRDNVDPGFGNVVMGEEGDPGDSQDPSTYLVYRRGARYSFVVAGAEYQLVLNRGSENQKVLAKVSCGADGPAFPLRLIANTVADSYGSIGITNITRGGNQLSTILSVANQIAFYGHKIDVAGGEHAYLDIYQNAKAPLPDGVHTQVIVPPL